LRPGHRLTQAEAFLSVITVWELRFGAARLLDSENIWRRVTAELFTRVTILEM